MPEDRLDLKKHGIRDDITIEQMVEVLRERFPANGKKEVAPDMEIEGEAEELLQDPGLVTRFLKLMKNLGQVGEETNAKLLLIAGVSRVTPTPIAITVKGKSASGKSTLVDRVLGVFPPASVHKVTRLTPQSLFYLKTKDLRHSILYLAEAPGAQDGDYPLRVLISEGELTLWVPIKKEGTFITEELRIAGPIAYIQTTTRAALHPEGETRWFSIWTDEGEDLTREVLDYLGEKASRPQPPLPERELKIWQTAMGMLNPSPVIVPFALGITKALPAKKVRVRRDGARFLAIVEVCALLHQQQREKTAPNGQGFVIASREDYDFARTIAGPVLKESYREFPARLEKFLQELSQCPSVFTRRDVQARTKLAASTIRGYLTDLVVMGHLEEVPVKGEPMKAYALVTEEVETVDLPEWDAIGWSSTSSTPPPPNTEPDTEGGVEAPFQHPSTLNISAEGVESVETAINTPPPNTEPNMGEQGVDGVERGKYKPPGGEAPPGDIPLACLQHGLTPHRLVPDQGRVCNRCQPLSPSDPCRACGKSDWWWRAPGPWGAGEWVCGVCHLQPPGGAR